MSDQDHGQDRPGDQGLVEPTLLRPLDAEWPLGDESLDDYDTDTAEGQDDPDVSGVSPDTHEAVVLDITARLRRNREARKGTR